jgi:hypothetical protein
MSIYFLIGIVVVVGIGLLVAISMHNQPKLNKELVRSRWKKVIKFAKEGEAGRQQAIVEGDKLVDYVLRQYKISGDTMADRMRSAESMIPNYNQLWEAHKLRNKLVHEQNVKLMSKDINRSLKTYQETLKGLKAL